ncbi:selenocysteine-specific translation elongation factor [Fuchsiella alkaliacetigena]|uniref:selenocysteine-specific translation elongation factor n=1 Tax=Fuchsiella alkaliacetigena TaxID=957042 RepID=UPI00200A6C0D|nr:selenocysteine-specific translation elongation factor [Fuchsiella alkaliacetigena]MCK8824834.1 selenocysteine-specific translation elongation factor [Fuchsiella alkaliacetigena]
MKHFILGTAGHIDHGKTTLIERLTGTNTDRLSEEQERGISIDLGFSSLNLANQVELGIVDVPGHEKFVKNMLAGAGGIDLALLVVSADEGVMPQTLEHLNILQLLGVNKGLVAVTKVDLVDQEWLELVKEDIKDNLAGTFLKAAPLIEVSSVTGQGVEKLTAQLEALTEQLAPKDEAGNLYFPLDRVFSIAGFGTVVTGTLISGSLEVGEEVVIYPQVKPVTVRNIQIHGESAQRAVAGQRVGVNLTDIEVADINRGDILATPGSLSPSTLMDVKLSLLPEAPLSLEHNDRLRVHIGAKEVFARVSILEGAEIYPGEEAYVQLRLEEEMVAYYNQPYVVRRYSPMLTIGGGKILFPQTIKYKAARQTVLKRLAVQEKGSDLDRVELALKSASQTVKAEELILKTGLNETELIEKCNQLVTEEKAISFELGSDNTYLHLVNYSTLKNNLISLLEEYHQQYHLRWGRSKEELRDQLEIHLQKREYNQFLKELVVEELIEIKEDQVKLAEHKVELSYAEKEHKEAIEAQFRKNLFTPPSLAELKSNFSAAEELFEELFRLLLAENKVQRVAGEIYFHRQALLTAEQKLKNYLQQEEEIEISDYRDLLASSRKYTLALFSYFEQQGLIERIGDKRVLK